MKGGDKVEANIVKSYRHGDAIIHIATDSYDGKSKREIDEIYLNACRVACRIARNAQMTERRKEETCTNATRYAAKVRIIAAANAIWKTATIGA